MTAPANGGGRQSAGIGSNFAPAYPERKQIDAPVWAADSDAVRQVMGAAAGDILSAYAGHCPLDRGFLYEAKRPDSRRDFDNLARLVYHARQSGNVHAVSDALRTYELSTAPALIENVAAIDLHLAEEAAEAALDQAQLLALQDGASPARAAGIVENGRQALRQISRVVDYYARRMSPLSHARNG